jgi:hypothetical protein
VYELLRMFVGRLPLSLLALPFELSFIKRFFDRSLPTGVLVVDEKTTRLLTRPHVFLAAWKRVTIPIDEHFGAALADAVDEVGIPHFMQPRMFAILPASALRAFVRDTLTYVSDNLTSNFRILVVVTHDGTLRSAAFSVFKEADPVKRAALVDRAAQIASSMNPADVSATLTQLQPFWDLDLTSVLNLQRTTIGEAFILTRVGEELLVPAEAFTFPQSVTGTLLHLHGYPVQSTSACIDVSSTDVPRQNLLPNAPKLARLASLAYTLFYAFVHAHRSMGAIGAFVTGVREMLSSRISVIVAIARVYASLIDANGDVPRGAVILPPTLIGLVTRPQTSLSYALARAVVLSVATATDLQISYLCSNYYRVARLELPRGSDVFAAIFSRDDSSSANIDGVLTSDVYRSDLDGVGLRMRLKAGIVTVHAGRTVEIGMAVNSVACELTVVVLNANIVVVTKYRNAGDNLLPKVAQEAMSRLSAVFASHRTFCVSKQMRTHASIVQRSTGSSDRAMYIRHVFEDIAVVEAALAVDMLVMDDYRRMAIVHEVYRYDIEPAATVAELRRRYERIEAIRLAARAAYVVANVPDLPAEIIANVQLLINSTHDASAANYSERVDALRTVIASIAV